MVMIIMMTTFAVVTVMMAEWLQWLLYRVCNYDDAGFNDDVNEMLLTAKMRSSITRFLFHKTGLINQ